MTALLELSPAPAEPEPRLVAPRPRARVRRWSITRVLSVVLATIAVAVVLYPEAAAWFADRAQSGAVSGYTERVDSMTPDARAEQIDAARAYNAAPSAGAVVDPYSTTAVPDDDGYFATLGGRDAVIATLRIPSIGVNLPVYHGTSEATLAKGAGHIHGTSLPVGGVGTHSALAAHNGFPGAELFDRLDEVALGDTFTIEVMNETRTYVVDDIRVVKPTDVSSLRPEPGHEYVTLVTCTPTGVSSHRLLVRGTLLPETAAEPSAGRVAVPPLEAATALFPWWILGIVAAPTAVILLTRPRRPQRR